MFGRVCVCLRRVSVSSVSSSGLTLPEVEEAIQRDKEKRLKLEAMAAEKNQVSSLSCLLFSLFWFPLSFVFVACVSAMCAQEVDGLGRLIDEIPTRAELLQYERRFTELYDQVRLFSPCFYFLPAFTPKKKKKKKKKRGTWHSLSAGHGQAGGDSSLLQHQQLVA